MGVSRLQDDLLQGFHEEKLLIREQLELFDPLAVSLRRPAAQRLLNKSLLIFYEIVCYLFSAAAVMTIVFMSKLYPFYLLHVLRHRSQYTDSLGVAHLRNLQFTVAGLLAVAALLFFIIARMMRRVRLKNDILNLAGKHIKTLVGQHLKRKAAMEAIEQRHFREWPGQAEDTGPSASADSWKVERELGKDRREAMP